MDFTDSAMHSMTLVEHHTLFSDFVTDDVCIGDTRVHQLVFKISVVSRLLLGAKLCAPRVEPCEHRCTCLIPGAPA